MSFADPTPSPPPTPTPPAPTTQVVTTDEEDIQLAQATPPDSNSNSNVEEDTEEPPTQAQRVPEFTYENTPSILLPKRQTNAAKLLRMRVPPAVETGVESPSKKQKQKQKQKQTTATTPSTKKSRTPTPRNTTTTSSGKKKCASPTHLVKLFHTKSKPPPPVSPRWVEWLHYHLYPTTAYHPRAYGYFPELTEDGLPRLDAYRQEHNVLCNGCRSYRSSLGAICELLYTTTGALQRISECNNLNSQRCEQLEKQLHDQAGQVFSSSERELYWRQRADAERQQRVYMEHQYRRLHGELSSTRKNLSECLSANLTTTNRYKEMWLMGMEDCIAPRHKIPLASMDTTA